MGCSLEHTGEHLGLLLPSLRVEGQPAGHPIIAEDGVDVVKIVGPELPQSDALALQ